MPDVSFVLPCLNEEETLAGEFSTQMLTTIDHRMLASAYHRGWPGILATYNIFTAEPDVARQLVKKAEADYVAICTTECSFVERWGELNPGSLSHRLTHGDVPDWLTPLTEEPAVFYRVQDRSQLPVSAHRGEVGRG